MALSKLRFFFDPGAGGCLWAGDEVTESRFGYGPLDAAVFDVHGHIKEPPRIPLPTHVQSLIQRLDEEYYSSLNPIYPPDPSLWTQARCDRFNTQIDRLLNVLRTELETKFVIVDQQNRLAEDPTLDNFLAANPDQKSVD